MRASRPVELHKVAPDVYAATDAHGMIVSLLDTEDLRDLAYTAMAMLDEVPELTVEEVVPRDGNHPPQVRLAERPPRNFSDRNN
jgi:hypothetical protein